jgi:hypothetical protein
MDKTRSRENIAGWFPYVKRVEIARFLTVPGFLGGNRVKILHAWASDGGVSQENRPDPD